MVRLVKKIAGHAAGYAVGALTFAAFMVGGLASLWLQPVEEGSLRFPDALNIPVPERFVHRRSYAEDRYGDLFIKVSILRSDPRGTGLDPVRLLKECREIDAMIDETAPHAIDYPPLVSAMREYFAEMQSNAREA